MRRLPCLLWLLAVGVGCNPLASRVFQAGLEANLGADLREELEAGLHVLLCGAGGPLPDPHRGGPCVAVIAGRQVVVVDAGSGAARSLARLGLAPGVVAALFLTHFHSDHIDGIGELATLRWVGQGHTEPLPVYGPPGVSRVTSGFNEAYALDAAYRTAHHGEQVAPRGGAGLVPRGFELPGSDQPTLLYEREGLRVLVFAVDHAPVAPAVGYRFEYAGRSVVVSGDTARSSSLERAAQDVDLLVHDGLAAHMVALMQQRASQVGLANLAKIASDIPDYHATPVAAAELAQAAGAKHLLFYHIVPPLPLDLLEGLFLQGVAAAYAGPVTLGRDGTLVSLPQGSTRIVIDER